MAVLAIVLLALLPCFLILKVKRLHHAPWFGLASGDDVILGSTIRFLSFPLIQARLSEREQKYHASIFGRSGSGKSKLLQAIFLQHVRQGKGVGIIEPHHDLSFDCLTSLIGAGFYSHHDPACTHDGRRCPYRQVVYIDWANGGYVPFNILKSPAPHHTIAANVLDALHRC